jgi:hypothetical protein
MRSLFVAVVITALSASQPASGRFDGSWTATFEGQTFVKLEIKTVNGAIEGRISLGNIEVDPKGLVKKAAPAPAASRPIFGATLKGSTLSFFSKDVNDTDQFELRLLENAEAELHFFLNDEDKKELAASGVPPPKPIRLTKAG